MLDSSKRMTRHQMKFCRESRKLVKSFDRRLMTFTMMDIVLMMFRRVSDEVVARSRVVPLAMMTMMVVMVMVVMVMMVMALPTVLVIQRRGGSRC